MTQVQARIPDMLVEEIDRWVAEGGSKVEAMLSKQF